MNTVVRICDPPRKIVQVSGQQNIVVQPEQTSVTVNRPLVRIVEVLLKGPKGDPGTGTGDLQYSADLTPVSASFLVQHNLGKNPSVSVVDTAGSQIDCLVTYIDANTLQIDSNAAFSGTAYLN